MDTRILIVESGNLFTKLLRNHKSTKEWKIYRAYTLKEILHCLGGAIIDVILLNLVELKQNGILILKKILKLSIPVITINSGNQLSLSIEGMKLGVFDDFLMPLNLDALLDRIDEASKAKIKAKQKFPLMERIQSTLVAATYAEAGEAEIARVFLKDNNVKEERRIS